MARNSESSPRIKSVEAAPDPQVLALKVPPHSVEAEQSVLGGLLLDNQSFDKIADMLSADDFYRDDHRRIFRQIAKMVEAGRPADVVTVSDSIDTSEDKGKTGGGVYLASLAQNTPSAANIRRYAEIVREKSLQRTLAHVATEIVDSALNPNGQEISQLLERAEISILEIGESGARVNSGFQGISPVVARVIERVDHLYNQENKSDVTGVPTGFVDLDRMTSGLQPGDLVIVAGRPSMGKTAFALNIAEHVAVDNRLPVAVFSMEMSGTQLVSRVLSSVARVDAHKLRTGQLVDADWSRLTVGLERLNEVPLFIDETPALTAGEVRSRARRLRRQCGKLGLIVIDYLQLMSGNAAKGNENRATEISEISRSLKAMAKELDVPVIALSQLSRAVESRPDKQPMMSDLRESGAIEQDADVILFIYRDEFYHPEKIESKGRADVIIGKQRNGPTGKVTLTFVGQYTRFENFASPQGY